jgi:hypothetical protein
MHSAIFKQPMTGAERVRRHRARRRAGIKPGTHKEAARLMGISGRTYRYISAFERYAAFQWNRDIIEGKHGRVGFAFLAMVCAYGSAAQQRLVHDTIIRNGAAAGRAVWRRLAPPPWELWAKVRAHASADQRRIIEEIGQRRGQAAAHSAWRQMLDAGEVVPPRGE